MLLVIALKQYAIEGTKGVFDRHLEAFCSLGRLRLDLPRRFAAASRVISTAFHTMLNNQCGFSLHSVGSRDAIHQGSLPLLESNDYRCALRS